MKNTLLAVIAVFTLSQVAIADRGLDHDKEICQSPEVKALVGTKGLCNIVMAPASSALKGTCKGILMGQIPCVVSYDTSVATGQAGMKVFCGEAQKPILEQKLMILSNVYQVKGIVRSAEGKFSVKKDSVTHGIIQSGLIEMMVSETSGDAPSKKAGIVFTIRDVPNAMTNVVCE